MCEVGIGPDRSDCCESRASHETDNCQLSTSYHLQGSRAISSTQAFIAA
ncbi:bc6818e2-f6c0-4efc-84d7-0bb886399393 [Sclerotinia trifoliorum]|uniref:Bc6818e2-f6c0-4efc-84d7-0bb886399393 n=1 Tax=Sclerotinia trifoliorum TaxID=28548 RepID=A0A8H2ZYK0_9HELO|nr:bc6818e2-f6c0-4efc-84d7-0bb886399393 [Sclerotinia trifoliorum]